MICGLINFSKEDFEKLGNDGRNALINAVISDKHEEVERIYRTLHPMSNEEWLRSCTTEELVDYIYAEKFGTAGTYMRLFMAEHEDAFKDGIRKWLKEVHH